MPEGFSCQVRFNGGFVAFETRMTGRPAYFHTPIHIEGINP